MNVNVYVCTHSKELGNSRETCLATHMHTHAPSQPTPQLCTLQNPTPPNTHTLVHAHTLSTHPAPMRTQAKVLTVDNGRHGENNVGRVVDDGVHGFVPDDGQVLLQVALPLTTQSGTEHRLTDIQFQPLYL